MASSKASPNNGGLNILEQGIFETAKSAFTFPSYANSSTKPSTSSAQAATPATGQGSLNFGEGAFPAATQAAFGGMGGSGTGIGYGGFAQGATITIGAPVINMPAAASAPSGMGGDTTGTILIIGVIMTAILIIAIIYGRR
jgi:hypothetical protein